jgi:hypothetical protein
MPLIGQVTLPKGSDVVVPWLSTCPFFYLFKQGGPFYLYIWTNALDTFYYSSCIKKKLLHGVKKYTNNSKIKKKRNKKYNNF